MKPFFKLEDFAQVSGLWIREDLADKCNELLSKRGVRVTGWQARGDIGWNMCKLEESEDTHQALLINIEELPKPECAHEANWWKIDNGASMAYEPICYKCKIKLKASWSPA